MQQKWNQNFDGEPMTDIPQKFLNAGCDVYMVMQLRHDEKNLDERFASMRELHRRGKTPDPEHYEVTYYADLPSMWQDGAEPTWFWKNCFRCSTSPVRRILRDTACPSAM